MYSAASTNPSPIRDRQSAMEFGLLLQQVDDVAQRNLDLRIIRAHRGGGHNADRRDEFVAGPVVQLAQQRSFIPRKKLSSARHGGNDANHRARAIRPSSRSSPWPWWSSSWPWRTAAWPRWSSSGIGGPPPGLGGPSGGLPHAGLGGSPRPGGDAPRFSGGRGFEGRSAALRAGSSAYGYASLRLLEVWLRVWQRAYRPDRVLCSMAVPSALERRWPATTLPPTGEVPTGALWSAAETEYIDMLVVGDRDRSVTLGATECWAAMKALPVVVEVPAAVRSSKAGSCSASAAIYWDGERL